MIFGSATTQWGESIMHRSNSLLALLSALVLGLALTAGAGDPPKDAEKPKAEKPQTEKPSPKAAKLAAELKLPLADLQAQQRKTGLGWGNLEKAYLLAKASGKTVDDIIAMKTADKGWGKIAQELKLDLGKLLSAARGKEADAGKGKGKDNDEDAADDDDDDNDTGVGGGGDDNDDNADDGGTKDKGDHGTGHGGGKDQKGDKN